VLTKSLPEKKVSYEVVVQKGKAMMFDEAGKYSNTGKD